MVGRNEMGSAPLLEGFASVCPVEGMRHGRIVIGDELSELGLEVGHRGEVAAADALSLLNAEEDLDLVEPRAVFGQVNEADPVTGVREELAPRRHGFENAANVFFPVDRVRRTVRRRN